MELRNSSYQRQLVAEKKKTLSTQEEIRALQEELERLNNKLKVHVQKITLKSSRCHQKQDCASKADCSLCKTVFFVVVFFYFFLKCSGKGERTRCEEYLCQSHGETLTKKRD